MPDTPNKFLKRARAAAQLTQRSAANAIGVSITTLGHWEAGRCLPSADKLAVIAKTYGIDVAQLANAMALVPAN
ncbi:MAG: helix-turn-helix transcriptional regulator [Tepidisphaeraceae bacterium]